MMPTDRFERHLPVLLTELAEPRTPDYLHDLLSLTAHTSQRPAWTCSIERWDYQPQNRHFMPVNITALELDRGAVTAAVR